MGADTAAIYMMARVDGSCFSGPIKIGIARNPAERLRAVQTSCPFRLELAGFVVIPERKLAEELERDIHRNLAGNRSHGEWFDVPLQTARIAVCKVVVDRFKELYANLDDMSFHDLLKQSFVWGQLMQWLEEHKRLQSMEGQL